MARRRNADKPHLWKTDIAASVDQFNQWFMRFAPSGLPFLDIVARMKRNEIRGTEPPSISLCAIEATKSTLYAVFSRRRLGERE